MLVILPIPDTLGASMHCEIAWFLQHGGSESKRQAKHAEYFPTRGILRNELTRFAQIPNVFAGFVSVCGLPTGVRRT